MNVIFTDMVLQYLKDLTDILYQKKYFGFYDSSVIYVEKIVDYITSKIDIIPKHKAPPYFTRYGKNLYYITYRPNRKTTWYIFFMVKDDRYLIRYITNNHVKAHYIRGLK